MPVASSENDSPDVSLTLSFDNANLVQPSPVKKSVSVAEFSPVRACVDDSLSANEVAAAALAQALEDMPAGGAAGMQVGTAALDPSKGRPVPLATSVPVVSHRFSAAA